jgi:predicted alternative tryptophan synthase beta-subunit
MVPLVSHAIAAAIDEANKAKQEGKEKAILFCWSAALSWHATNTILLPS